ncbi:MAG: LLM class flavin-dependent oxidoreductase [Chromatiales bacterium]|nr:LLM class flavin-dependent oxidoreductase [Chromatiales bacterium]
MIVAAGLGLTEFPFSGPRAFWRWVDLCEAGGVDSLWQSDRLVSRIPMLECMSLMAALAGRTRRLKFGMNVVAVGLREPLLLARQCATIDLLSEGRLLPGYGVGSPHSPDWDALGVPSAGRGRRADEALEILSRLLAGERLTFEGEFFTCRDAWLDPRPVQSNLPFWFGGSGRKSVERTARLGSGWIGGRETPPEAAAVVTRIQSAAAALGRRIPDDHFGASFFYRFGSGEDPVVARHLESAARRTPGRDPRDNLVVGDAAAMQARIAEYVAGGVTKFVLRPLGADDDDVMAQTRLFVERLLPEIHAMNRR